MVEKYTERYAAKKTESRVARENYTRFVGHGMWVMVEKLSILSI